MFRQPAGKYPVGIKQYDTGETGNVSHRRRVPLTFYYPSFPWKEECPYRDAAYQRMAPSSTDNGVHTFCGLEPPLTGEPGKLPVIIYNHGLKGFEMESTVLCADLASNGYLVVSVGHPYGASIVTYTDSSRFEDPEPFEQIRHKLGETEPLWYEDILEALSCLQGMNRTVPEWKNRISTEGIGIAGVSFGGCCAVTAALKNEELAYAINLDGSFFTEPEYKYKDKPIMVMCSPFNFKAHLPLVDNGCSKVTVEKIKKLSHFEFSDGIYLSDKGKSNREWADRISRKRSEMILDFIRTADT